MVKLKESRVFKMGMPSDQVLIVAKQSHRNPLSEGLEVGADKQGLIVKWYYSDVTLTFRLRTIEGISCYRITKIEEGMTREEIAEEKELVERSRKIEKGQKHLAKGLELITRAEE